MNRVAVYLFFCLCVLMGCDGGSESEPMPEMETEPEVVFADIIVGDGAELEEGMLVSLTYTVTETRTGRVIDSSDEGILLPVHEWTNVLSFLVGSASVPEGLNQGVVGMKPGGTRIIEIPSDLAFPDGVEGLLLANTNIIMEVAFLALPETEILTPGQGTPKEIGDQVSVLFEARLSDGTVELETVVTVNGERVDSVYDFILGDRLTPRAFGGNPASSGGNPQLIEVMTGMHYGMQGMLPGETRRITLSPAHGLGSRSSSTDTTPADSTLTVDVELIG
ncbi:MAG: FKBP-type peptidyl-prolyl cis-trans isomerase [Rhodothermaceae bacterium]|nr:FKBP-type peptidyl-prolyl cis-trans isomerase [Rhodothermaceae bacterium]